jgi:hypothetical protein
MPGEFAIAAFTLVATSGAEVPIATIVRPIMSGLIPNIFAMATAPFTSQSAPFIKITRPTSKSMIAQKRDIWFKNSAY